MPRHSGPGEWSRGAEKAIEASKAQAKRKQSASKAQAKRKQSELERLTLVHFSELRRLFWPGELQSEPLSRRLLELASRGDKAPGVTEASKTGYMA